MSNAIWLISGDFGGVRASLLDEDGLPQTLNYYRCQPFSEAQNLFAAVVSKIDTANDQAFLNIGDKTAVLTARRAKHLAPKGTTPPITIKDCVQEGDRLLVQAVADEIPDDGKNLTVTARPRLMGRYVVIEQGASRLNISKTLDPVQAKAIENAVRPHMAEGYSVIIRSGAASVGADVVSDEAKFLISTLLLPIQKPGLTNALDPLSMALRDTPEGADIWVDGFDRAKIMATINTRYPDLAFQIKEADQDALADAKEALEEAIEEAVSGRIQLPSGGWIGVYETPALTAIDVNLGGALQNASAADAKRITNFEAALATAFHLRFQNMGGLVVVDFINMTGKGAVQELMRLLDEALAADDVPVQHTGLSQFGLMELSRARTGLSLKTRLTIEGAKQTRVGERLVARLTQAEALGNGPESGSLIIGVTASEQRYLQQHDGLLKTLEERTKRQITLKQGAQDIYIGDA